MFHINTRKLNIKSGSSKDAFTMSHVLDPKKFREKRGSSYIVIQLDISEDTAKKISEIIKDIFEAEYYKDPQRDLNYGPRSISTLFEQAIHNVNKSLGALETEGYVTWDDNIHVAICTIKNTEIHLAYTGKSKAMLLRDGAFIELSQSEPKTGKRIFGQTVSGVIKGDDMLLISTPELLSYISTEKIKRSLESKGIAGTEIEIDSILKEIDIADPISSLFIHVEPKAKLLTKEPTVPKIKKEPVAQIDDLATSTPLPETLTKQTKETTKKPFLFDKKISKPFTVSNKNQALSSAGYTDPLPQQKSTVLQKLKKILESFFDTYLNTKAKGKIIGISAGVLALVLVVTIGSTYFSRKKSQNQAQAKEIISLATEKETDAANAIIYRDYKSAEVLLDEALQKLENDLDNDSKDSQEVSELKLKIAADFDKINKVNRVEPTLISELPSGEQTTELIGSGARLFIVSKNNAKILQYSQSDKKFIELSNEADGIGKISFGVFNEDKETIALLTENAIAEMPLFSKKIANQGSSFARDDHTFVAMTLYEDKIYFLDTKNNQIYRHVRTVDGYGLGKEWIDDETVDVSSATSFAIDSNVYVMNKNGTVTKLSLGEQESFELTGFTERFSENTHIFTSPNTAYIYIFDAEHKILAVFSKKGELVNQYAIELPEKLHDIHIDEENQTAYVLSENSVYSIPIQE